MKGLTKLILTLLVGAFLAALCFFSLMKPMIGSLSKLNQQLKEKQIELVTLDQQIKAFTSAQSDLTKALRKEEILKVLVSRENLVEAVKNIETDAAKTNTTHELDIMEELLQDERNKNETPPVLKGINGLEEIPYRLLTIGDFTSIVNFIRYLEHLPQFTEVTKVILSAETVESETSKTAIRTGNILGSIDGIFIIKKDESR